jgi:hypothetical protein
MTSVAAGGDLAWYAHFGVRPHDGVLAPAGSNEELAVDQNVSGIRDLLHEAGETHHRVYRMVDGNDDDWASWYADWLIKLSELPQLLGRAPVRSELVYQLVKLDKEYTAEHPEEAWEDYYARAIARELG